MQVSQFIECDRGTRFATILIYFHGGTSGWENILIYPHTYVYCIGQGSAILFPVWWPLPHIIPVLRSCGIHAMGPVCSSCIFYHFTNLLQNQWQIAMWEWASWSTQWHNCRMTGSLRSCYQCPARLSLLCHVSCRWDEDLFITYRLHLHLSQHTKGVHDFRLGVFSGLFHHESDF